MEWFDVLCGEDAGCSPLLLLAQVFAAGLLGILFGQSALDKVLDWSGNIGWITEKFSDTPFAGAVTPMVGLLTLFEAATGAACALGALLLLFGIPEVAAIGFVLAGLTFLQLFFGLRITKDYPGAAQLAPYFLVMLAGLALASGSGAV